MSESPGESNNAYQLAGKALSIASSIVLIFGAIILVMLIGYLVLLGMGKPFEATRILELLQDSLAQLLPIVSDIIRIIAPVIVLFLALGFASKFSGAAGETFKALFSDLPSVLALIIVFTVCVIPFVGTGSIPQELSNIALVVVGFYFGKKQSKDVDQSTKVNP